MQKEEIWHCANAEIENNSTENKKPDSGAKSKKKTTKALKDPAKRINDYFPVVPKANAESSEDNRVGAKDDTRITEQTTPDKSAQENGKIQTLETAKSKYIAPYPTFDHSLHGDLTWMHLHYEYPWFGAKGNNFYIIVNQEKKAPSTSEESKLFEDKLK